MMMMTMTIISMRWLLLDCVPWPISWRPR